MSVAESTANALSKLSASIAFVSGDMDYRQQRFLAERKAARANKKETGGEEVLQGLQKFGNGVKDGVSGLFLKPLQYAQQGGALGFIRGIGIGLGGVIAKPAVGTNVNSV